MSTSEDKSLQETGATEEPTKQPTANDNMKEVIVDGYAFTVDTDLLDDVEAFEYIDRIENKGQTAAIVPLLTFMVDVKGYEALKKYFTTKDAEEHAAALKEKGLPADPAYRPRMRMQKLQDVYFAIIEKFDPKG